MDLNDLLEYLSSSGNYMVNMHDVTGILSYTPFDIEEKFRKHTLPFCDIAKSTPKGYLLCTSCKTAVCKIAVRSGKPFFGMCPYGLFELVYPIKIDGKIECILFVGNQTEDLKLTAKKAKSACERTGVAFDKISKEFGNINTAIPDFMLKTAELTEEFIKLTCRNNCRNITYDGRCNRIIETLKRHVDEHYDCAMTLKKISELYFMNEKYLGRIFLKQTGQTFKSYLNMRRLEAAAALLEKTDRKVIDISLECGFNSISYFNRIFLKKYNKTPVQYRKDRDCENNQKI